MRATIALFVYLYTDPLHLAGHNGKSKGNIFTGGYCTPLARLVNLSGNVVGAFEATRQTFPFPTLAAILQHRQCLEICRSLNTHTNVK